MRVLAVSYFLPPALYPQAIQIGRLLFGLRAEVGLLSGGISQPVQGLDTYADFDKRFLFRLNVDFRPFFSGLVARIARRFLPFYARIPDDCRGWIPLAERAVGDMLKTSAFRPDVIVTFGEPMSDHLLGLRLKNKLRLPWVAHFSDPWADNPFRRFNILSNFINRRLERRVIAHADHLIFTSRETVDLVMKKYPPEWREKCSVLPHSFDPALYSSRSVVEPELVVRYVGNFYGHRTPLPLFRALHLILREQSDVLRNVRFEFVGQMPARMQRYRELRALPKGLVQLVGSVTYSHSLRLMTDADLLLVIDGPDDVSVFLPSKLIDYVGAGVPICGIVPPGASANLLHRLGAPVANPSDIEQIAHVLSKSLQLAREKRAALAPVPWGDFSVRREFVIDHVAEIFFSTLDRIVQQPKVNGRV